MALLFIDVDRFKELNDTHGHLFGDNCLKHLAVCLTEATWSPTGLAARYGGDEFAVILPATEASEAEAVAARLHEAVQAPAVTGPGAASPVYTISIGVAATRPHSSMTPACLLNAVDQSLYEAKSGGRARVAPARILRRLEVVAAHDGAA